MPRVVVVLDIDTYAKDSRRVPYKGLIEKGEFELGGWCPQCDKDFLDVDEIVYGKAVLADGTEWFQSGKSFLDGGVFVYENKPLEWLFENFQLWGREGTITVCSRECAEIQELRFRQTQVEIELKNNPDFRAEHVVIHGTETPGANLSVEPPSSPSKQAGGPVPSSPAPAMPTSELQSPHPPTSPAPPPPFSPTPASPAVGTPTTFRKGGRAPPPPPPTPPPSVSTPHGSNGDFKQSSPFPSSPSSSSSSSFPSSTENPVDNIPTSPTKSNLSSNNDGAKHILPANGETRPENVAWCVDELNKVHKVLADAAKRVAELTALLERLQSQEAVVPASASPSHFSIPLPSLPEEDDHARNVITTPPPMFTAPILTSEADDDH